jgi:inosose dehydratase
MKAAVNVWTWGTQNKADFEQALKEVSDIGYRYVENIGSIGDAFADGAEFDNLLARFDTKMVCGYYHLTGNEANDRDRLERYVQFAQGRGIPFMNVQAAGRPAAGPTPADLAKTVATLQWVSERAQKAGIVPCLHPHYQTIIEQAHEIAYVMERVDRDLLALTLDTGHTVLGGMDPVATFRQYADRVRYVHMKDVVTQRDPARHWAANFRELGRGVVDFLGIKAILEQAGFDGYLTVELDMPRVCGYKSAAISRLYLQEELGL